MASAEEEGRRLFVGGLNGATTDATFRAHFASFFPVANAEVSKHIYVCNPSIILRFTGTPTKSSKYKIPCMIVCAQSYMSITHSYEF